MTTAELLPDDVALRLEALLKGRTAGEVLSQDDLHEALDGAEPTEGVIAAVLIRLEAAGVELEEHEDDEAATKTVRRPRKAGARVASSSSDPVQAYLAEIGHVPLLDQAQEFDLATTFQAGEAARVDLARHEAALAGEGPAEDELSSRQVRSLKMQIRRGDEARAQLIEANLRLVVSVAKRYRNRGVQFLDLIQEGNLGLMRAVEKFDPHKGFKFSTYATWWIRQAITKAVADQSRNIRIPVHLVEQINRVIATQRQMTQELGHEVANEELAQRLDLPVEKVADMLRLNLDTLSLEQPMGDDDFRLSDTIVDKEVETPEATASRHLLDDAVHEVLGQLDDRERAVVMMRFGIESGKPATLDEVGRTFGITRERVRQIEVKTIAKLRRPERATVLRSFLEGED